MGSVVLHHKSLYHATYIHSVLLYYECEYICLIVQMVRYIKRYSCIMVHALIYDDAS